MEEYLELFISETESYVRQLNAELLNLESDNKNKNSILEVFRILHTIKGMAQTMGYEEMATIAHQVEDYISEAKTKGELRKDSIGFLFLVADYITDVVQMLKEKKPLPSGQRIIDSLKNLITGKGVATVEPTLYPREIGEIRIKTEKLDRLFNLTNELFIARSHLLKISQELGSPEMLSITESTARLISTLQDEVMRLRMLPLALVFDFFPRWVRDEAKKQNKEINFLVSGGELEVDRSIIDVLKEPIMHLLRNALDHGIEKKGTITLSATREREFVRINVTDDGKGIDLEEIRKTAVEKGFVEPEVARRLTINELYKFLLRPDFSTKREATEISGRGIGLDIVYSTITELGGRLEVFSEKGKGSTFSLELPITLAIQRVIIFALNGARFALPLNYVRETFNMDEGEIKTLYKRELFPLRDEILPLVRIGDKLGFLRKPGRKSVIVVQYRGTARGFITDEILSEEEIVVKKIDPLLPAALYSGYAIYADGRPILVLDPKGFG